MHGGMYEALKCADAQACGKPNLNSVWMLDPPCFWTQAIGHLNSVGLVACFINWQCAAFVANL